MVCENCQKLADDVDTWKTKYKEVKEERDDFLKVLQAGNARDLKMDKKVKSKKVRRLIDLAIELGLIEKFKDRLTNEDSLIQRKEKDTDVTNEWNELDIFIDKPQVKKIHLHVDGDKLLKKAKKEVSSHSSTH